MTLALLAVVVLAAFTLEAALGFGATVVTVALGTFLLPIDQLLAAFVPLNVALSAVLVARNAEHVSGRLLLAQVLPAVVVGLPLGMLAFRAVDERTLKLAFGGFVVLLGGLELAREARGASRGPAPALPRPLALGLLGLGGVIHGAFATGGPMIVYVLGRTLGSDKARFRATLSVLWLVLNSVLVVGYALEGRFDRTSGGRSLALALPLALGLLVGEKLHHRVDEATFRRVVFGMLTVVGLVILARNV